jgi:hypothetical protein
MSGNKSTNLPTQNPPADVKEIRQPFGVPKGQQRKTIPPVSLKIIINKWAKNPHIDTEEEKNGSFLINYMMLCTLQTVLLIQKQLLKVRTEWEVCVVQ